MCYRPLQSDVLWSAILGRAALRDCGAAGMSFTGTSIYEAMNLTWGRRLHGWVSDQLA